MVIRIGLLGILAALVGLGGCGGSGEQQALTGPALFKKYCAVCHGEEGKGKVAKVDMTTDAWQKLRTDEQLAKIVKNGTEGPEGPMPPFGSVLKDPEVDTIVKDAIRKFNKGR